MLGSTEDKDVKNFLLSIRIQALADCTRDLEDFAASEKQYQRAQTMVGNMWGDDHPAIIPYNGNLVTCYSTNKDARAAKMPVMKQIIQKNLDIAKATFGDKSIHILYHLSANLINKIALGEINTNAEANPLIKWMREVITTFHGGDPRALANQFFFQI